jgi:hypothetical protein
MSKVGRFKTARMAVSRAVSRFLGTKAHYDDLTLNAEQILIAMVAVLMRYIGSCKTTDDLAGLFEKTAISFAREVNKYIAAACRGAGVPIRAQMKYTITKSRNDTFLENYQKKILTDIFEKFEHHYFTRGGPDAAAGEDVWEKWNDPTTSFILIDEFFGSVFLFYYLGAIRDNIRNFRMPKIIGFEEIERIRLCLFRDPQSKIKETGHDIAYYGDIVLTNKMSQMSQIGAFRMLCQAPGILRLIEPAQVFSLSPLCSSLRFRLFCNDFMNLPAVLPLFEFLSVTMSSRRTAWLPDIPHIELVEVLNTLIKTVAGIFNDGMGNIGDFKVEACSVCFGTDTQRRANNTHGTAGFIPGRVCSKLCPNSRMLCTSCAYNYYSTSRSQRLDAQRRDAAYNREDLPRDWRNQMPEDLRCPLCNEYSFGAEIVPFIVAESEPGGITIHPVINQLIRAIIVMLPDERAQMWVPILNIHANKPSIKRIVKDFKDIFFEFFKIKSDFCHQENFEILRRRWMLLDTKINNPTLAQFIPNFAVIQKVDICYFVYQFLDMLEKLKYKQDQHQAYLDDKAKREKAEEAFAERWRNAHMDAPNRRSRSRSRSRSPVEGGGRLNRRTKKRSHGKNLPKSKSKSKSIKSKSKSKKYNKTKSNRL